MKQIVKDILQRMGYDTVRLGTMGLNAQKIQMIIYIRAMYDTVKDVDGAIVECGVGKGKTFLYLSTFAWQEGKGRHIWGFDSFEGFPEPTQEDKSPRNPQKGEWNILEPDDVKRILTVADIDPAFITHNVHVIKGFVEDTLPEYDKKPIAFLHVDVDLYSGHKVILETLVQYVAKNGLVLFDDYGRVEWPGATKAVDDFLKDKPWKLEYFEPAGRYYFIKR